MLKQDYEKKLTTLNQPFEIGESNNNGCLRLREIDINNVKMDHLYPHRQVIRFNSTFLEVIDSWEFVRGRATILALPIWCVGIFGLYLFSIMGVGGWHDDVYWFVALMAIVGGFVIWNMFLYYKIAKYDIGGYTHYPIRFNRKTQKVYAFSPQQQKIIELNWHDLHFSAVADGYDIELRASLIDQKNIVKEEIIFPFRAPRYDPELIEKHLAFFKAYMQGDNLKKIDASIPEFFDIYNRKESFRETFERVYMIYDITEKVQQNRPVERHTLSVALNIIFWLPILFSRRLGLLFSKIPKWPDEIEKKCQIDNNDPYNSIDQQRHLEPLKFKGSQIFLIFLSGLILFGFAIIFCIFVIYFGWKYL